MTSSDWMKERTGFFETSLPVYILDDNFNIVAWNQIFEKMIAQPMGLSLGMQVTVFVFKWENGEASMKRAGNIFGLGKTPKVDHEPAIFFLEKYGRVKTQKLATYVESKDGKPPYWFVSYSVVECDKMDEWFDDLMEISSSALSV